MPKERFHLFLADECFKVLGGRWLRNGADQQAKEAYLLGSIMPDTLYYDLPNFSFSMAAKNLHRFEGEAGWEFFGNWLEEVRGSIPREIHFWMLGMATHYLSDGFWHPLIVQYAKPRSWLCRDLKFSSRSCHHWLESQMEAYWLPRVGPPGGYCDVLKALQARRTRFHQYFHYLRELMIRAESYRIPKVFRVQRCFFWQTTLLQVFAHPRCAQWKARILDNYNIGQSFGVLIVPPQPADHFFSACRLQQKRGMDNPCDGNHLARSIHYLTDRLSSLPAPP